MLTATVAHPPDKRRRCAMLPGRILWLLVVASALLWPGGTVASQSAGNPVLTATPLENSAAERNFRGGLLMDTLDPRGTLRAEGFFLSFSSVGDAQAAVHDDDFDGHRREGYIVKNLAAVDINLERLCGWRGASFYAAGVLLTGEQLSSVRDLDNYQNVSSVVGHNTFRLGELWMDQSLDLFGTQKLDFRLGQLAAYDEFALQDTYSSFVANSFSNPQIKGGLRAPTGSAPQPGLRLRWEPTARLYLKAGLYNGDNDRFWIVDKSGVAFRFKDDAVLAGEIGYRFYNVAHSAGLAGDYKVGLVHDFGRFTRFGGGSANGNDLFYFMASQELYRANTDESALRRRGFDVGAGAYFTPHPDIDAGVAQFVGWARYTGLYPGRPRDVSALGVAYALPSRAYRHAQRRIGSDNGQAGEVQVEINHEFFFDQVLSLQPNLQLIVHPDGDRARSPILVLGVRHLLTF